MQLLPRFWKTLDEVPGMETDRLDWYGRLGEEFPFVEPFLRASGLIAERLDCPSAGGDNCPRIVVELGPERYRAVCGNNPAECETLEVNADDISILALDRRKLTAELSRCLDVTFDFREDYPLIHLGRHFVAAGAGFPVVLLLPHPQREAPINEPAVRELEPGSAILIPAGASLSPEERRKLTERGHLVVILADSVGTKDGRLTVSLSPDTILHRLRSDLLDQLKAHAAGRLLLLPPNTRWQNLTFEATAMETVVVHCGRRSRRFGPDELGLRDRRKKERTKRAWTIFIAIIASAGVVGQPRGSEGERYQKRKQELSDALRKAFGINDDPIEWRARDGVYAALFGTKNSLPKRVADDLSSDENG